MRLCWHSWRVLGFNSPGYPTLCECHKCGKWKLRYLSKNDETPT